ncbi:hypothetical protein EG329_003406 [Mollisiaceae sp. DMI_Dod_QoI]|nr:hypothetical protein EG329_003406 [Helotiales sp. DMI_Dod_QoI]
MPATRCQTSKVPSRSYSEVDIEFDDEEKMLQTQVPAKVAVKPYHVQESANELEQGVEEAVIAQKFRPVFETFESDKKLDPGLCIVRPLGGGKYEIVNLQHVDQQQLSSQETGLTIRHNEGRRGALTIEKEDWQMAILKCEQAIKSASGSIFRFQKLPIELRYRIYDFAIITQKPLRKIREDTPYDKTSCFALMQTCKDIYQEARPFFYRNNFHILDIRKHEPIEPVLPALMDNMREVTFSWLGIQVREIPILKFLATCKNLKTLNVILNSCCLQQGPGSLHYLPQKQYQNDDTIKKFRGCRSFDRLVSLRGLERINVCRALRDPDIVDDAERKAFEDFLNRILTQPKPISNAPTKTRRKPRPKSVQKTKRVVGDDDDVYSP